MDTKGSCKKEIVHKWLSFGLLSVFIYYWLFTFSLVFFNRVTRTVTPGQTMFYYSFFNQNWRLFSKTKPYSSEVNLVVREINSPFRADTIGLVSYNLEEKRKQAPFNNYPEAVQRLLTPTITDIAGRAAAKKLFLKKQYPGQEEDYYTRQASILLEGDSINRRDLNNLWNYGKYVAIQKNITTAGKEFQLILIHNYIRPAKAPVITAGNANEETVFISTFKPL